MPKVPPNDSSEELAWVTAGSTVFSAMTMPTPMTTTMVEWPREKKYPKANGRGLSVPCRSPITLRVVLSIAEM